MAIPTVGAAAFADDDSASGWDRDAVAFMAERGIPGGAGDNKFNPQGSCKREKT